MTVAAKCNIITHALDKLYSFLWGFGCKKETDLAIIENYIEYLDCPDVKQDICYPESDCDNPPIDCNFTIVAISSVIPPDVLTNLVHFFIEDSNILNAELPLTYLWEFNEDDFYLVDGSTVTDPILKIHTVEGVNLESLNAEISVTVTDAKGCQYKKTCFYIGAEDEMQCSPNFDNCPNPESLEVEN